MIRIKLKQMLDDKAFKEGRRITLNEVSEASGIARATLNRIANSPGYNTTTGNLDALCEYFGCTPGDLLEYVAVSPKHKGQRRRADG
jgi:putative transcriptional regulator